ncbi:MAG: hypothetical protein ACKOX3_05065 [Bacteroidota bacterium]
MIDKLPINKTIQFLLFVFIFIHIAGCKKEEVAPPATVIDVCTLPNGFLKWNDNIGNYCATTAFADEAITMTINGVSTNGPTITFDLANYTSGTHSITESTNSILYTNALGFAFTSSNTTPGTLNITSYSPTNHQIKGNFNCKVFDPTGLNAPINLSGSFSMYYTF